MSAPIRHERVEANGLEFHVNACGEGDRLALCLHGFPELGLSWDAQLPALAGAGYRAWAPDLRGYGGTVAHAPSFVTGWFWRRPPLLP